MLYIILYKSKYTNIFYKVYFKAIIRILNSFKAILSLLSYNLFINVSFIAIFLKLLTFKVFLLNLKKALMFLKVMLYTFFHIVILIFSMLFKAILY